MPYWTSQLFQVPGQGPASYLDAAQREKALQSMQQMSSAQIVSATSNMHSRMVAPPVSYGGFWQHPGLGGQASQDVKPFAQSPFLHGDKTPTSLGKQTVVWLRINYNKKKDEQSAFFFLLTQIIPPSGKWGGGGFGRLKKICTINEL